METVRVKGNDHRYAIGNWLMVEFGLGNGHGSKRCNSPNWQWQSSVREGTWVTGAHGSIWHSSWPRRTRIRWMAWVVAPNQGTPQCPYSSGRLALSRKPRRNYCPALYAVQHFERGSPTHMMRWTPSIFHPRLGVPLHPGTMATRPVENPVLNENGQATELPREVQKSPVVKFRTEMPVREETPPLN